MASIGFNFNASSVQPSNDFSPIPAGSYIAQITDSKIGANSKNTGMRLDLTWTILEGQYANRKLFDSLNIQHQNPVAEKIGQEVLSAICHATGVMNLQDSNQLHARPVKISVKIRPEELKDKANPNGEKWPEKNEIKGYSAIAGGVSAAPAFAPQAPAPQATQSAAPPWAQKAA